jgi:CheY-like chemotaxis protein
LEEKTVLIIDADAPSRIYLGRALTQRGYQVLQAASGKEGLILAWRERPAAIVIDPRLPDLGGEEVVQKLRKDPRTASTPCLAPQQRSRSKTHRFLSFGWIQRVFHQICAKYFKNFQRAGTIFADRIPDSGRGEKEENSPWQNDRLLKR